MTAAAPAERKWAMGMEQLLDKASTYMKQQDLQRVREAYEFAEEAHRGQTRKSGEPYILHPVAVAEILVQMQMDVVTVMAALLHDVVEDTTVTLDDLRRRFGDTLAGLVDGLTKLERIQFRSKEEQQNENYRKMFVAMANDIRVILIKLADRLHNMRTLKFQPEESQRRIAHETLEIYCPIAHRLGISAIKWEMEDIALRFLNPQQYYRIANLMQKKRAEREQYIADLIAKIRVKLDEMGIHGDISGRPKHIYSIYKKMTTKNKQFNEIYDLLAIRILVDNVKDCYATLGIIHTLWKPMPGRFKDYIAMPKANMYQSLHTTVVGPTGEPTEVQIRTFDMHRTSEYGIAAHWAYKEGKETGVVQGSFGEKMNFIREIIELQQETSDAAEFMESLKMDFFTDLVFVFSPKGEVFELPAGSVPLDFAYRVHTEVGNRTIGAKVNGRIVPLDHKLKTGDIVEILTSKHSYGPSQDWLKIAQSSHARSKIRQWFKREKREENVLRTGGAGTRAAEDRRRAVRMDDRREAAGCRPQVHVSRYRGHDVRDRIRRHYRRTDLHPADRETAQGSRGSEPDPAGDGNEGAEAGAGAQDAADARRERQRRGQPARAVRPLLQPGAGRRDHRIYHPRPRRVRPPGRLPQHPERGRRGGSGAGDRSRVGGSGQRELQRRDRSSRPRPQRAAQ
jgi:GTP pyrophosphokinase